MKNTDVANLFIKVLGIYFIYITLGEGFGYVAFGVGGEFTISSILIVLPYILFFIIGSVLYFKSTKVVNKVLSNHVTKAAIGDDNYRVIKNILFFAVGFIIISVSIHKLIVIGSPFFIGDTMKPGSPYYEMMFMPTIIGIVGRVLTLSMGIFIIGKRDDMNIVS